MHFTSVLLRTAAIITAAVCSFSASAHDHPNILFVYTDDQALWAVGESGNEDVHTPNMDRIANEGAYFTNAFVATPVCSPSRVELLTSRYGTEVGITDWISPNDARGRINEAELGLDPKYPTWAEDLQTAGYRTGIVGKWHLGKQDRHLPANYGYDYFMGFREGGMKVENPMLEKDGEIREYQGLTMDILTDHALEFINDSADDDAPFILSLHYRAPHAPWKPVKPSDDAPYEGKELDLPNPDVPNLDTERIESVTRQYYASVTGIDRNLGRVLELLDKLDIADDTIVIFTSDHGYNIGHRGLIHKGNGQWITTDVRGKRNTEPGVARPNMFDTSIRVPLLVRWPGVVEPGMKVDEVVSNLDWYPTLLSMTGVDADPPDTIHGRDFTPLLCGRSVKWDDTLFGEYSMHHYVTADMRMIRTPEWKLIVHLDDPDAGELYHLAEDLDETTNLFGNRDYLEIQSKLQNRIDAWMQRIGNHLPQDETERY